MRETRSRFNDTMLVINSVLKLIKDDATPKINPNVVISIFTVFFIATLCEFLPKIKDSLSDVRKTRV